MHAKKVFASSCLIYDVIVIGGGHAGCEAAAASSRTGAHTALLTHRLDAIGEMSCNPSFGGIGKGHLIREVDAMDGVCGRVCDKSAITYQALNSSSGPAVLGLRAQIDRSLYKKHMQEEILNKTPNLTVIEGSAEDLVLGSDDDGAPCIRGVAVSDGNIIPTKAVVLTTGTFLGGCIFQGMTRQPGGRIGEKASTVLSTTLSRLGFKLGRLRTGTPPRLLKKTIDFSRFTVMPPDRKPIPFSFLTKEVWLPPEKQLPTFLSYTNDRVAQIVQQNFHKNEYVRSDAFGPRYCPSLESKIMRFPDLHHRLFLEHEGLNSDLIYPQGMSMTFQPEVQLQVMQAIPGLENVEIAQYGYGVEYDFLNPQQLKTSLETKLVHGLFCAGQINGTTGYEEAAAQGVLAGVNAAALSNNRAPLLVDRTEGYVGVLVDDLTSLGTSEPYRIFTSRAEFRLYLRPDNADLRLTEKAYQAGAVSKERFLQFSKLQSDIASATDILKDIRFPLGKWMKLIPSINTKRNPGKVLNAFEMLYRYDISLAAMDAALPNLLTSFLNNNDLENRIRIQATYEAQHERLKEKMKEVQKECAVTIPDELNYSVLTGLSQECKEKFQEWRPQNLAAASRIPGVTPEALCVLLRHLKLNVQLSRSA